MSHVKATWYAKNKTENRNYFTNLYDHRTPNYPTRHWFETSSTAYVLFIFGQPRCLLHAVNNSPEMRHTAAARLPDYGAP